MLFGTLAYYLRLWRTPPHSGATFNYAEKAEYLAFMWGSVVMTVTGFALWFANLTLEYLPGWVPDVATAVHFYEAILASLAIVVWHFYWVIFDPDVLSDGLDLVGRAPAESTRARASPRGARGGDEAGAGVEIIRISAARNLLASQRKILRAGVGQSE